MSSARPLILSLVMVATVAGCDRDKPAAPPAAPVSTPPAAVAETAAPFAYETKTPYAEVKLALPQAIKPQTDLHARLYADGVRDLSQFVEGSRADRTEAGGDGGLPPYEKTITYDQVVSTGKLFSMARTDYDYTGGAHGNPLYAGVIWDKAFKRMVTPATLFRSGASFTALDRALCAAINADRKAKDPRATTVALNGKDWSCPLASKTPFVLATGSVPGKAGGLTFLIGPYQVGPYSDGSYTVSVGQNVFRDLIAPAYADEFAGGLAV